MVDKTSVTKYVEYIVSTARLSVQSGGARNATHSEGGRNRREA